LPVVDEALIGRIFREESGRSVATLVRTFGDIPVGRPLLYEDSSGRLGFADNQADAARRLGVAADRPVTIRPA